MIYTTAMSLLIILALLLNLRNIGNAYRYQEGRIPLWPVLLFAALALIFMSSYGYLHDWDERYHALVGKHMANNWSVPTLIVDPVPGFDETQWGQSGVWLHKQPFTSWCIGGAMWLFGDTAPITRGPSVLFTLLAVYCTFRIGKLLFNQEIGVMAAFLHASNGKVLETAAGVIATDHVDTIFVALVELSVLFAIRYARKRTVIDGLLIGLFCGLAVLTKWLTALLVFPLLIYLLWAYHRKPKSEILPLVGVGLVVLAVFMPWQLYILEHYPILAEVEYAYNRKHITEALQNHAGSWWFYLDSFRRVFGETIFVVFAFLLFRLGKKRSSKQVFLWWWLGIPLLFFSIVATKMSGYLLIAYPAVCLLIAVAINEAFTSLTKLRGWRRYALTSLLIATFLLPIRYGVERIKLFQDVTELPAWQTAINEFTTNRATAVKKTLVFGDKKYVQLMFAGEDMTAYPFQLREEYWPRIDTTRFEVFISEESEGIVAYILVEE